MNETSNYLFGSFVWICICLSICIIYLMLVLSSLIFRMLYQTTSENVAEHMTNAVSAYGFHEEYIDVSGVKIHYVIKDATACSDNTIVFIHGTASSSVTFFEMMKAIPKGIRCIAIDLPMFGISGHIDIERYKTNQELCKCYADVIGNTLQKLGIVEQTVLVAHSLGGFLSVYVADRFPIKKLVLVNPAGILPTLGEWGYYWGVFFKTGLPTTAFHLPLVSRDGLTNMGKVMYGGGGSVDNITDFWLYFYSNPNNEGHRILQRLITIRPFYSYWNTPAFTTLLDVYKKVPTTICFGESDTIIPSHIGGFIDELTQGEIMIYTMKNANHNPCVNIECMVEFLSSIINGTWRATRTSRRKTSRSNKQPNCRGFSYHSLTKTNESFTRVYEYLLAMNAI